MLSLKAQTRLSHLLLLSLIGFGIATVGPFRYFQSRWTDQTVTYPKLTDFWLAGVYTCIICVFRYILQITVFVPLAKKIIVMKDDLEQVEKERRITRFAETLYNSIYYVGISVYGWYTLHDLEWVSNWIPGAHGDNSLIYHKLYSHDCTAVQNYYMISLGFCLTSSIFFEFFRTHGRDYFEYSSHHYVTISLIVFSYSFDFVRVGSLVLFLHDFSDVFTQSARVLADTVLKPISLVFLAVGVLAWIYFRILFLGKALIWSGVVEVFFNPDHEQYTVVAPALLVFLAFLLCLHAYWISNFVSIIKSNLQQAIRGKEAKKQE